MPDRIVRDELLTSERYWSVSIQAQQLYVHLLLVIDDAARFSGKNFTLRASCFPGRPIEANAMEKMLSELADVDLVRLYVVGADRFVFVPRFRNRRRYMSSSEYPTPPNGINDLPTQKSALSQPQVIPETALSQEERGGVGVGLERSGVGRKEIGSPAQAPATPPTPFLGDENEDQYKPRALVLLADKFELPSAWGRDAEALGWTVGDILKESEKFRQYWVSGKGIGKRRSIKGWRQSWSNWLGKAERYKP